MLFFTNHAHKPHIKVNYIDTYKEIPLEGSIIENIKSLIRETFSEYISTRFKVKKLKNRINSKYIIILFGLKRFLESPNGREKEKPKEFE